jgi:ABC-type branched-subunit amino acid transport system ATPase component
MISSFRNIVAAEADHQAMMRTPEPSTSTCQELSSPRLLRVEGLRKSFGGQLVLNGIGLQLHQGEVVLLRGENGSGKTTLLNILTGNLEPDAGAIHYVADSTPRTYRFPRRWWQQLNPFDHFTPEFVAREGLGRTWQDVRLFGGQSLRDNLVVASPDHPGENPLFALLPFGGSGRHEAKARREADALLAQLDLEGREGSSADKISLGQSKRVAIARAVAAGSRILFLDEPLAGLDSQGICNVLKLLEFLVRERQLTLVIVEHVFNQRHLRHLVTTDWMLERGRITISPAGAAEERKPAAGGGRPDWFFLLGEKSAEIFDEPLPRGAVLTRIRPAGWSGASRVPALEIRDLLVKRGPRAVIGLDDQGQPTGLNLTLYEGETVILQAPNGWGKSTLFAAVTGLISADQGDIRLGGRPLRGVPPWERVRRGLCAMPSDRHTFPSLRGRDALALGGGSVEAGELAAFIDRPCSSLSGGQKQRIALASTPVGRVNLFDEPMLALDTVEPFIRKHRAVSSDHGSSLILTPSVRN